MKLFKSLLIAPATLGLLAPMTATANELNITDALAVESVVSKVLEENPDISILIEGHTDNIPFTSRGAIESNWDLSTKRATAVVKILLENNKILPQNLTASGKSEFVPIAPNTSVDGRAANRRIEIILSPSIDKIMELINLND